MLTAFLLDDEKLATDRLSRLLAAEPRTRVLGASNDPVEAIPQIESLRPDLLFLDIQMPELDGFGVLRALRYSPLVIFTTAYDKYALQAFETNSVAYLLKPIEAAKLIAAVNKVEAVRSATAAPPDLSALIQQISSRLVSAEAPKYPERVSSRTGDKVEFIDLTRVTHFYAEDKLTFAATESKSYVVDQTITELETKLDPSQFLRIHRSTLVNLSFVSELYTYFGGKLMLRLKDSKRTELLAAKERAKELRERLGI
jgi:two-component system LytT family response regulator